MNGEVDIIRELQRRYGDQFFTAQTTCDGVPTLWVQKEKVRDALRYLNCEADRPYRTLYDLTAIDERVRKHRHDQPDSDFTVVYHLLSYERNEDIRIKVALKGENPSIATVTDVWPSADWYERELWDMFGVTVEGHPNLRRILMPPLWKGHPLRKEHPARGTELGPFPLTVKREEAEEQALKFRPEDLGLGGEGGLPDGTELMYLNLGPHHAGTHGILRIMLALDGEEITDAVLDIGYHHRGAEKMGERQSWHTFIPYTDRIDYMAGVLNNFPYVLAVEKLAGIEVPDRAKVIRIMIAELFRIISHLVFYGTFAQDVGQLSPVFFTFSDRERAFDIIQAICGGRMHPSWFRIGGVAQDLPDGWDSIMRDFLTYLPSRLDEYDKMVMQNSIIKGRTKGVGTITLDEAIQWGVTGPNLRACGFEWDFRKKRPYSGYEQFEFDVPTGVNGDCYDRVAVRVQEMRESLRIIGQCIDNMPPGPYKSDHPLATPPLKEHTMHDIETLITHFLNVSWGPVVPPGEAAAGIEGAKGNNTYYLISDGNTSSYRTRIRTPSFPNLQTVPLMARGLEIADLIAIIATIDYVLGDVDR